MRSLKFKFIIAFLGVALISIVVIAIFIQVTSSERIVNLIIDRQTADLKTVALAYYEEQGSWVGFFNYLTSDFGSPDFFREIDDPRNRVEPEPVQIQERPMVAMIDLNNRLIFPAFGLRIGEILPDRFIADVEPVVLNGETIAFIVPDRSFQFKLSAEEKIFLERTTRAIVIAALIAMLGAVVVGIFFANLLIKPIERLKTASQKMAAGDLDHRVPVTSKDELGQLSESFNKMSADLKQADEQRKQITADITHDLGTPLQVISGYMEMLEDNPSSLTPKRLAVINNEIEHLRRMLADLNMLSQADAKSLHIQVEDLNPEMFINQIYQTYQPVMEKAGIHLRMEIEPGLPSVSLDEGRMLQVFKNLLENAKRYTPQGGSVILFVKRSPNSILFGVQDNGDGISPADLPYIFDRFYRADSARTGEGAKSGLGLAISKALVQAQGGTIKAYSDGLGSGTSFQISFPLN